MGCLFEHTTHFYHIVAGGAMAPLPPAFLQALPPPPHTFLTFQFVVVVHPTPPHPTHTGHGLYDLCHTHYTPAFYTPHPIATFGQDQLDLGQLDPTWPTPIAHPHLYLYPMDHGVRIPWIDYSALVDRRTTYHLACPTFTAIGHCRRCTTHLPRAAPYCSYSFITWALPGMPRTLFVVVVPGQ